jgi:hypothetical protein
MALMTYYTTANKAAFQSRNPRAAYINLSQVHDWIKTTVVINGQMISIPRWLMLDLLSIEQILDPARQSVRHSKDRLTIQPELTQMLAEHGYRFGRCMKAFIPKPQLSVKDIRELGYADTVRQELREKSISYGDVVKKVIVSFFEVRPDHTSNRDAVVTCMDVYGWNWFEFQAAWLLYHREENQWVAPNDPRFQSPEVIPSP